VVGPKKLKTASGRINITYLEGDLKMSEFGEKLINLRTELGLSVKEACQRVGIPQSRLSELERGVRIPTPGQIERLGNFYATGADELGELAKLFEKNLNN